VELDSAFYIGTTHEKCEDYALHYENLIMISDGCSSSSNTDIGSRLICEVAKKYDSYKFRKGLLIPFCSKIVDMIGIPQESLDVTLLSAYVENNHIFIEGTGDGNIIICTKNNILHILSMSYELSAPYYMSYILNKERDLLWQNIRNNKFKIVYTRTDLENTFFYQTTSNDNCEFNSGHLIFPYSLFRFSPTNGKVVLPTKDIKWVALSSDGLNSFYTKVRSETSDYTQSIDHVLVIRELMKIKNTNGKFVQRRMNKFRKTCEKLDWHNADDISLAVISL
jgi:hypothetical protein